MIHKHLYLAVDGSGSIRRGSYMHVPGTNEWGWVFHPEEVKLDHYYGNMEVQFMVSKKRDLFILTSYVNFKPTSQTSFYVEQRKFYMVDRRGITIMKCNESENTLSCLKNRLREYSGAPIIPISKGLKRYKEWKVAA